MNIDYQKIINISDVKSIEKEEYERLLRIAATERRYLKCDMLSHHAFSHKKSFERIYMTASYKEESLKNKAIISANINYPDSKKLAEYLIQMGYNEELIGKLIVIIRYVKLAKLKESKTEEELEKISLYENHIKKLIYKLGKYFSNPNPETTLNKIIEIYALTPELLNRSKSKIKKID